MTTLEMVMQQSRSFCTTNAGNSLGTSDGGSVAIGGGANLGVDALDVGGNDNILSVGHLDTGDRCSSCGSGVLAVGKGGDILCVGDGVVPTAGGSILGTCNGGGLDHVAIHDFLVLGAFMTVTPLPCSTLLHGRCLCCCMVVVGPSI
jgi:hypothetical protein